MLIFFLVIQIEAYNKRTLVVEESMHITFDESNPSSVGKVVVVDE